jgi:hypothetical protein
MTVRLQLTNSLLGVLVAALAGAGAGCADTSSKTDLLGQPKILQVFVMDPSESADPDGSGLQLTFGVHQDVNLCTFDNTCTTSGLITGTTDKNTMLIPGEHCDTTSPTGPYSLGGHCVLDATSNLGTMGQQPIAQAALIGPGSSLLWVVVGDLLDGATLEEFACACQEDPMAPGDLSSLDPANCGSDATKAWSSDPLNCGGCGGSALQSGKCEDTDGNGVPDVSALLPGVATITCGSLLGGAAGTTGLGDGYYWPSGYQLPARGSNGWLGIGPAIAITPSFPLPADQDCTLTVNSSTANHLALDKKGAQLTADGDIKFHTEPLSVSGTSPADMAEMTSDTPSAITVTLNTFVKSSTVSATTVTISPAVAGTKVDLAAPNKIEIAPATTGMKLALTPATMYTVTVSGNITDIYGSKLGEDATFSFTTK